MGYFMCVGIMTCLIVGVIFFLLSQIPEELLPQLHEGLSNSLTSHVGIHSQRLIQGMGPSILIMQEDKFVTFSKHIRIRGF